MNEELKPCPFCGESKLVYCSEKDYMQTTKYFIRCKICGASGGAHSLQEKDYEIRARADWNRRVLP